MCNRKLKSNFTKEIILNYLVNEMEYRQQLLHHEVEDLKRINSDEDPYLYNIHLRWAENADARYEEIRSLVSALKIFDAE